MEAYIVMKVRGVEIDEEEEATEEIAQMEVPISEQDASPAQRISQHHLYHLLRV